MYKFFVHVFAELPPKCVQRNKIAYYVEGFCSAATRIWLQKNILASLERPTSPILCLIHYKHYKIFSRTVHNAHGESQ